jgi:hypothetical protein
LYQEVSACLHGADLARYLPNPKTRKKSIFRDSRVQAATTNPPTIAICICSFQTFGLFAGKGRNGCGLADGRLQATLILEGETSMESPWETKWETTKLNTDNSTKKLIFRS